MIRKFAFILAALCFASGAAARKNEQPQLETWYVDSLVKIFPGDARGTAILPNPEFTAARNQHINVQLAVRSSQAMKDLRAEVKPLKGPSRHRISGFDVHHVGYVMVRSHTPDCPPDEIIGVAPGPFPDPLQDFPLELEANKTSSVWVTIHIPADAAAGVYQGSIVMRSGHHVLSRNPFTVRVVNATVPQQMTLKVTNWFELNDKTSRQFYDVAVFSPEWWTLVSNVAHVFAAYRQNVVITPLLELIQPRVEDGALAYDYSNFDRWVETFQKAGSVGYIEGGHLVDRASGYDSPLIIPTIQIVDDKPQAMPLPPDDARVATFLTSFLASLNAHLKQRGWDKIYFQHILDEAHGTEPPYYAKFAGIVHQQMPGIPTFDAVDAAKMPEELKESCDVWVPQLGRFDDQMQLINERLKSGHPVWYYTCLFPQKRYINRLMDYPLVKVRLLPWLDFRYGFTGFLHWGGNYWTPDPMKDAQPVIENNTEVLPPGDAFIVYPDREHRTFRSSIRLETMRAGIEDYEMLRALRDRDPAAADQIANSAITSFTEYVRDVADFRKLEQKLLDALSRDKTMVASR